MRRPLDSAAAGGDEGVGADLLREGMAVVAQVVVVRHDGEGPLEPVQAVVVLPCECGRAFR